MKERNEGEGGEQKGRREQKEGGKRRGRKKTKRKKGNEEEGKLKLKSNFLLTGSSVHLSKTTSRAMP